MCMSSTGLLTIAIKMLGENFSKYHFTVVSIAIVNEFIGPAVPACKRVLPSEVRRQLSTLFREEKKSAPAAINEDPLSEVCLVM